MDTGEPTNLFSNLLVLYAMYWLSYSDNSDKIKIIPLKIIRGIILFVGFICFIGWLDILTIKEVENQYYIAFSESMKLGEYPLINVHIFIVLLGAKMAIFSAVEWTVSIFQEKEPKQQPKNVLQKTKGA